MTHVRTLIRNEAAALLVAGGLTSSQVYKARVIDIENADLPAVLVYANDETVERGAGRKQVRTLELMFEVIVKGNNPDDELDSLSAQIEATLTETAFVTVPVKAVDLVQTTKTFNKGGEYQTGTAEILYNVVYLTTEATPETARN